MTEYILVLEVESISEGQVFTRWPLHCTLVHWFYLNLGEQDIMDKLQPFFNKQPQVKLIGQETAKFGKKHDVEVNLVVKTPEILRLHKNVLRKLQDLNVQHSSQEYLGAGYSPHVTVHHGRRLGENQSHQCNAVYLVKALDSRHKERKVLKRFTLEYEK